MLATAICVGAAWADDSKIDDVQNIQLFLRYNVAVTKRDHAYLAQLYAQYTPRIQQFKSLNYHAVITNALLVGDTKNAVVLAQRVKDSSVIAQMIIAIDYLKRNKLNDAYALLSKTDQRLAYSMMYLIATYQDDTAMKAALREKIPDVAPRLDTVSPIKNTRVLYRVIGDLLADVYPNDPAMLQLAAYISPDSLPIRYALLISHAQAKNDYMVAKIAADMPRKAQTDRVMEHIYKNISDPDAKQTVLNRITTSSPAWYMSLAYDSAKEDNYAQAEKHLLRANKDNVLADDWNYWYRLGIAYERQNKIALARDALNRAIAKSDDDPQVVNYLAYTEIIHDIDIQQNLEKLKVAYEKSSTAYIADSVGWAYYHIKQYDKALFYAEKASETLPMSGVINDHLGDIYFALGRHREALVQWKRALLDTEEEDLDRTSVQQKINTLHADLYAR